MMGMDDDRDTSDHHHLPQQEEQLPLQPMASLSKDNLLLLDRKALEASVKARYYDSLPNGDAGEDTTDADNGRLEGDKDGSFAVASVRSSTRKKSAAAPVPEGRARQRRIKVQL